MKIAVATQIAYLIGLEHICFVHILGTIVPTDAPCMEYLPTFAETKSPSFVGKYTCTMEHMGYGWIWMFPVSILPISITW